MITVGDVLAGKDERKEFWPAKYSENPLAVTYKKLLKVLNDYSLIKLNYCRSRAESQKLVHSKNMSIQYQTKNVLKSLNNKDYIYLTPTIISVPQYVLVRDRNSSEYVAILKWEGRIGYCVLILGFGQISYGFSNPEYEYYEDYEEYKEYEEYGRYCSLMEVLSDGTTVLFERTVSWNRVKECKANTTSIRNLFFSENEIRLIGLKINEIMNNVESKPNQTYKCSIEEDIFNDKDGLPFWDLGYN